MEITQPHKLLVHFIDVLAVWIPINARHIKNDQYEILDDKEYDGLDENLLCEFFPGDIVVGNRNIIPDSDFKQASKLIKPGSFPDRSYFEFQFHAALKKLSIDKKTADKYRAEIKRIKKEKLSNKFFYPGVFEAINSLI